jgi:hypothetical protein
MVEEGTPEPESTESAGTADAGTPQERPENEAMGDERPDYDARQERIREDRLPMGPPLAESDAATPTAADMLNEEPPVDPEDPS